MAGRSWVELLRLVFLYLFLAFLALLSQPQRLHFLIGLPFVLLGVAVRLWASGHLFKTQELITSGPYRFTRNPLYLGRFLLLTGFAWMAWFPFYINVIVLVFGWLVFFGYYMPRKERIEPARLLELHGEAYRKYNAAVPALFPTLKPFADNGIRWRMERMLRLREQWTALVVLALVVFFGLRAFGVLPGLVVWGPPKP